MKKTAGCTNANGSSHSPVDPQDVSSWKSTGSGVPKYSSSVSQAAVALVAPTILEASLLHGVTTQTLMAKCGQAFQTQEFHVEEHYLKSFETDRLGDFISHDWASSRLGKLLALGMVYNSQAAMIASTIVSVVLCLLQLGPDPILPPPKIAVLDEAITDDDLLAERASHYGFWNTLISPLVFVLFFLFWQDLRTLLKLGKKTCFLDKYCIDQANPERKAAGIWGLAGFLRCSDRIIILWTPRYFTRLWCTYEVASWLHLEKPLTSVLFMPLAHASIVMTLFCVAWLTFLMLVLLAPIFPKYYVHMLATGTFFGFFIISHKARHSAMHLRAIKEQLMQFAVANSKCFCCSIGHVTPTGEPMQCDRKVVYTTIAEWFNHPGDDDSVTQEARLDRFDQAVRRNFAAQVLQKAGPTQLAYHYVIIAGWPFFLRMYDIVSGANYFDTTFILNIIIMYFAIPLAAIPLWYKCAMHLSCFLDVRVGILRSKILDMLVSLALSLVYLALAVIIYAGPWEFVTSRGYSPSVALCLGMATGVFNFYVYSSDLWECFCGRRRYISKQPQMKHGASTVFSVDRVDLGGAGCEGQESGKQTQGNEEKAEGKEGGKEEWEEPGEKESKAENGEKEAPQELDDGISSIRSI